MGLGFLFPGQGAQQVGMIGDIEVVEPAVSPRFEEASEAVGFDLAEIIRNGPAERLNQTEITQPALVAVGVALLDAWCGRGGGGTRGSSRDTAWANTRRSWRRERLEFPTAMAPVPGGHRVLHQFCPAHSTSAMAVGNSSAPAATRAEYSPRLCPATTSGTAPPRPHPGVKQGDTHRDQRRLE